MWALPCPKMFYFSISGTIVCQVYYYHKLNSGDLFMLPAILFLSPENSFLMFEQTYRKNSNKFNNICERRLTDWLTDTADKQSKTSRQTRKQRNHTDLYILKAWSLNTPFLVDKLDAAGADTGMVKRLVLGPLRSAHPTDVCCTGGTQWHNFT